MSLVCQWGLYRLITRYYFLQYFSYHLRFSPKCFFHYLFPEGKDNVMGLLIFLNLLGYVTFCMLVKLHSNLRQSIVELLVP